MTDFSGTYYSDSRGDTLELARRFAADIEPGDVIAMYGDLGAGKTVFVSGAAKVLGFDGFVTSPTFAIVNEYQGGKYPIAHFDMYRITDENDLFSTGFYDYLDMGFVMFIEWSENIEYAIEDSFIKITFSGSGDERRTITIEDGRFSR